MKKILLLLTLLFLATRSFGQPSTALSSGKTHYLHKNAKQKSTGSTLLVSGVALLLGSFITTDGGGGQEGVQLRVDFDNNILLRVAGYATCVASIPFFISAATNKHKAGHLSVGNQSITLPHNGTLVVKAQPAVTVRVGL